MFIKEEIDFKKVSIAIPTNGRPSSLRSCILSVLNNISENCQIYVLDSTPKGTAQKVIQEYNDIYNEFSFIHLIRYEENVPPGKARNILSKNINTEFALFLDDDLEIGRDSFRKMFYSLIEENYDIMSGLWVEKESKRCAGFLYTDLTQYNQKKVLKCAISAKTIPPESVVQLDDVQASLLIRMELFKLVKFDSRYDFFFELYDFFYQCKKNKIKVGVHTGALFYHHPIPYLSRSSRYYQNREIDRNRFIEKWGVVPEFALIS